MPIAVTMERFEELVGEALDSIPDQFADLIENVAVVVADWATPSQQAGRPGMLLGLYHGVNITNRSPMSYQAVMPDQITIFRGPHLRLANTEEDLRSRIAATVIHEIGHYFGIDDHRLRELGW